MPFELWVLTVSFAFSITKEFFPPTLLERIRVGYGVPCNGMYSIPLVL